MHNLNIFSTFILLITAVWIIENHLAVIDAPAGEFMIENKTREFKKTTREITEGIISIVSILNKHQHGELFSESKMMELHLNLKLTTPL